MGINLLALGASKKYTADTAEGMGAVKGKDGTSAYAKVERVADGVKLTVTDARGTTEAIVYDGASAPDGNEVEY